MSLRFRLAAGFAVVALATAAAVALAAPFVVGRGFERFQAEMVAQGVEPGQGMGQGPGPRAGIHAAEIERETTLTLVVVAITAAAAASLVGLALAGRVARPLRELEVAAAAVSGGDLGRRSGLAERTDELGALGRSFDAMAAELERTEAGRRRFFQDAVHELRTPLAVIDATTSAVLDGVYPHDDRHLDTIRDQARLLSRIVDDLRTISLAEAGALPLERRPVDTRALLDEVGRTFAARADRARIRIDVTGRPGLAVIADRDRLRQALAALIDNALRHTPDDGTIGLAASLVGSTVRLEVTDTGPGIAPEDLPHVFERFYQADPARDRAAGTSGLGLSIVSAIVAAHGGRVGAESAGGGGARFWLELPAVAR